MSITSQQQFLANLDKSKATVEKTFAEGSASSEQQMQAGVESATAQRDAQAQQLQTQFDTAVANATTSRDTGLSTLESQLATTISALKSSRDSAIQQLTSTRDAALKKINDKRACEMKRDLFTVEDSGKTGGSESCFGRAYNDDSCRSAFDDIPRIWQSYSLVCPDVAACEGLGGYGACVDIGYNPGAPHMGRRYNDNHASLGVNTNSKGEKSYKCPRTVPCDPNAGSNTQLNADKCPSNYPYRTQIPDHASANYKYCYKRQECALGRAACSRNEWTDEFTTLPSGWMQ